MIYRALISQRLAIQATTTPPNNNSSLNLKELVCSPILSYHFYLVFALRFVFATSKDARADYSAYLIYLAVMLLIPHLYILYIIFSLHLPSGVTSFAIQTSQNTQQQKVWIIPSQQQQQKRGNNIFSITNPEDLLDFISEDDRLCVGE